MFLNFTLATAKVKIDISKLLSHFYADKINIRVVQINSESKINSFI